MQYSDLKELYKSGKTIKEIAIEKGLSQSSCYRFLKKEKTRFRNTGRQVKVSKRKVRVLKKKGLTYREIAKKLATSHVTIFNLLKKKKVVPAQECIG